MSSNWVQDISDMQDKYGVRKWVLDPENKDRLTIVNNANPFKLARSRFIAGFLQKS